MRDVAQMAGAQFHTITMQGIKWRLKKCTRWEIFKFLRLTTQNRPAKFQQQKMERGPEKRSEN